VILLLLFSATWVCDKYTRCSANFLDTTLLQFALYFLLLRGKFLIYFILGKNVFLYSFLVIFCFFCKASIRNAIYVHTNEASRCYFLYPNSFLSMAYIKRFLISTNWDKQTVIYIYIFSIQLSG